MTGNTDKVRAVFLAALMVFSVFAGTVAFSGSVAAAQPTFGGNAVHYTDSGGNAVIEVPFEDGNVSRASLTEQNFTVLDDGDNITADVVNDYRKLGNTSGPTIPSSKSNATVIIELDRVVPSDDLEVDLSENIRSAPANDTIANPGEKSVVFAGQTIEHDTGPGGVGADSQAKSNNITAYQGVTVAVNASNLTDQGLTNTPRGVGNIDVTVEGEDNNYFQEGNTGNNSSVFTFDTSDRELGKYRIFLDGSDNQFNRTFINVRNLGLGVSVDDLTVSTDDTIETTTTAVASDRPVNVELLDSSGDTINATATTLGGQGEVDVDFATSTADGGDELETGTYTVEVTDNRTGVAVASSQIDVSEADDESAEFVDSAISEQRGDIIEATVELTETSEATINFGSPSDGVEANVTVEDDDGDDQVTVYINTFRMSTATAAGGNIFNLDSDSDDNILQRTSGAQLTETSDLIDAGDYDLEVEAGDVDAASGQPGVDSADDVATVTLQSRNTQNVRMWTGSSDELGSVSDLADVNEAIEEGQITQSSEIAVGDFAVHQIQVTGLEGALDARANEDVTSRFFQLDGQARGSSPGPKPINLTIEEADPGANQDARELNLTSSNTTVIADGPNDTYFVVVETGNVEFGPVGSATPLPTDDDTALETNFTIVRDNAGFDFANSDLADDENEESLITFDANEPEINVDEPFNVSQAEGQTVTGDTNIAPGTELTLRIRSDDGVSPSFLKTASPVVQPDGTYSATFDFSEQNVGDTYEIEVDSATLPDGPVTEDGEVVEGVSTDTVTPEPDTATPEPDTATPEPDTDTATPEPDTATPEPDTATPEPDTDTPTSTPTSTPGFGVVVALTALLAAALLAVRRND
jgi:surface glycoprotein (TIGR04207 family)/PGF-CTERM protein